MEKTEFKSEEKIKRRGIISKRRVLSVVCGHKEDYNIKYYDFTRNL